MEVTSFQILCKTMIFKNLGVQGAISFKIWNWLHFEINRLSRWLSSLKLVMSLLGSWKAPKARRQPVNIPHPLDKRRKG